jgi:hypothetical protein
MIYIISTNIDPETIMPKSATSVTSATPTAKPEKRVADKPKTVKKAAPAPAIKENAAAVKAEAKKIKDAAKADKAAKPKAKAGTKAKANAKIKPEAKTEKDKSRKPKLVRDSFTMPAEEYAVLGEVKKACLSAGVAVKKSELLRVGVALIRQLDAATLKQALEALPVLKAGRPKKQK